MVGSLWLLTSGCRPYERTGLALTHDQNSNLSSEQSTVGAGALSWLAYEACFRVLAPPTCSRGFTERDGLTAALSKGKQERGKIGLGLISPEPCQEFDQIPTMSATTGTMSEL